MNPRQRRGVIFMLLSGLAALALFVTVTQYVSSVNSQIAPTVTTYQAAKEIPAYSIVEADSIEKVVVPSRYVSAKSIRDPEEMIGRRVNFNVAKGTYLGSDMILPPSSLNPNEREIAMTVDAKTGIAGRVKTGDSVDVYAVFSGRDGVGDSRVLVRGVRVVSVGGVETRSEETSQDQLQESQVLAVTLALEPDDALKVTYADAFAQTVRLVGLPPGIQDEDRSDEPDSVDTGSLKLPLGEAR